MEFFQLVWPVLNKGYEENTTSLSTRCCASLRRRSHGVGKKSHLYPTENVQVPDLTPTNIELLPGGLRERAASFFFN